MDPIPLAGMKHRVVVVALVSLIGGCTSTGPLRPFTTDGCSGFPDGLPSHRDLWLRCCTDHDRAYWLGGTYDERLAADKQLRYCVAEAGNPAIAEIMLRGVRVGGSPWLPTSFRWGYGWPYGRGYQEIAPDEMLEALRLLNAPAKSINRRPAHWAQPLSLSGAPNLHKVSSTLYRSAQPSADGMKNLAALGIKTVINLRSFHSDRGKLGDTGLGYEHIFMKTWHPEHEDVVRFLRIAADPLKAPVLVHCQHGADRTGVMVALYRIAVQNWSKEEAAREMVEGGYGFHSVWTNLVPWLEELDIGALRRDAGIGAPPSAQAR